MAEEAQRGDRRPTEGADATSRLLEQLLAEGTPVAEIAVRLGISVPDAHARISGAPPGRATADGAELPARPNLLGSTPPADGGARAARPVGGLRPPGRKPPPEPERRGISRRAFLGMAAAGVAGMAAGGAFWATRGSSEPEPVARPARPVPVPPTLTPVPPPLAALQPATGVFRELRLEPGQPLTATHGIFFMRTGGDGAGSITGWQLVEPGDRETLAYRVSAGGRFVAAPGAMHDRVTGQSWVWPEEELQLLGFSNEAALFKKVEERPEQEHVLARRARYILTDEAMEEQGEFELRAAGTSPAPPVFAPGGRRAFLAVLQPRQHPTLFALDAATGRAAGVLSPQRQSALQRILFYPATLAYDGESFLMPYSYLHLRSPPRLGYGVSTTFVARLGWQGDRQHITRVPVDRAFASPDGSLVAGERVLRVPGRYTEEYETTSTVIVMDGNRGRIRFLIRSARLNYGDELWGARWLADSSALVVQSRIGGTEGYSLVSADGSWIEPLPEPPSPTREWLGDRDMRGPAPSPDNPSLIAYGRTAVYDRATDSWLAIDPGDAAPGHEGPWRLSGSDETVLTLPHQPHRIFPLLAEIEETHIEHNLPTAGDDA